MVAGQAKGEDVVDMEVETLLSRAADGVLPHDRIEALAMLSELLRDSDQVGQASKHAIMCVSNPRLWSHLGQAAASIPL